MIGSISIMSYWKVWHGRPIYYLTLSLVQVSIVLSSLLVRGQKSPQCETRPAGVRLLFLRQGQGSFFFFHTSYNLTASELQCCSVSVCEASSWRSSSWGCPSTSSIYSTCRLQAQVRHTGAQQAAA